MAIDVHRLPDPGLGNSAWLVDLGDGSALVVDPSRDPRGPLGVAAQHGLTIRWVAETHLHADFVSGARELLQEVPGASLLAPADADLDGIHVPVGDDAEIDLGGLAIRPLATPGHTPEHLSYLLLDNGRHEAVFTGGTLIVDGIARPDLISPEQTEPLARAAWRSITEHLLALPDDLVVYPTHGGGSFCSAGAATEATTTIGAQRASNPLLDVDGEDEFVRRVLDGLGSFPPYFLRLREVNRRGPHLYGTHTPSLDRLGIAEVDRGLREGARIIDVRPIDRYAEAHLPGSLSIELRDQFATWLGWLVEQPDTPLIFVIDVDQDRDDLVRQCLKVGYENIMGQLDGGVGAWQEAGRDPASTQLTDNPLTDRTIIDVRQRTEWDADHIPGATHVELGALPTMTGQLPDRPLVTHCGHGQRSMTAASLLEHAGRRDVAVFTGGPQEWQRRSTEAG